jgi:hypothetical protein|tara:strand:+ start:179 stop:574 length:396 start_codon:yes stop_codon:yes gene_type:complete
MKLTKEKLQQIIKEEMEELDEEENISDKSGANDEAAKKETLDKLKNAIDVFYTGLTFAMISARDGVERPGARRSQYPERLVRFEIPVGMDLDREEVAQAFVDAAENILSGARTEKRQEPAALRDPNFTRGT